MKTNQALIIIWLLVIGVFCPTIGKAKPHNTFSVPTPINWQAELLGYLDHVELSDWIDKSATLISFRLDEHQRIQDVIVIAKEQDLIRKITRCLRGRRMLNSCPMLIDELGNKRCAIRVRFDRES